MNAAAHQEKVENVEAKVVRRFGPEFTEAVALVRSGKLGALSIVCSTYERMRYSEEKMTKEFPDVKIYWSWAVSAKNSYPDPTDN